MDYKITVTNDNDPSCQLYTLSQEFNVSSWASEELLKECVTRDIETVREAFRATWPHKGTNMGTFLPTMVEVMLPDNSDK
jgi:hypothetical protein